MIEAGSRSEFTGNSRSPHLAGLSVPQLVAAVLLALSAYALVGANAVAGEGVVRALACGVVAGFVSARRGDWWVSALVGLTGALGGFVIIAALVPSEQVAATVNESVLTALLVAPAAAAGACFISSLLPDTRVAEVAALALVMGLYLYGVGLVPGPARLGSGQLHRLVASQPQPESTALDSGVYLQTYWKMRQGTPFYRAYVEAWNEDKRLGGVPPGLFAVRQPWIYYVWGVLPGQPGVKILDWFIGLACVTMAVSYAAARRFVEPVAALLAPIALSGYFALPGLSLWFPLSEYWGGMVAVGFVCALAYERWSLAAALAIVAFAFRELMVFLVPIYVIAWFLGARKKSAIPGLAAVVIGPVALFAIHAYLSPVHGQSTGVLAWLKGGVGSLLAALRFSGDLSAASRWSYVAVPLVALAGAVQARPAWNRWWLGAAVAIPLVSLTVFSNGQWGAYWGAIAQPLLMTIVPLAALGTWPAARPLR